MEKVLVVDDNPQNCELMADLLGNWGYEAKIVYQGMEAIAAAQRDCPDIILLDVMLPGMNGFEVCHEIKSNPLTRNIPIIMLTVLSEAEDRIQGIKVGADYFLSKPINYNELKFRLGALLQQKQRIDGMVEGKAMIASFLTIMKLKDEALYQHTCQVRSYCDKVGRVLRLTEQQQQRLLWAAELHDIGKIVDSSHGHAEAGSLIVQNLNLDSLLAEIVRHHHGHQPYAVLELEILATVNQFVNLFAYVPDKQKCLEQLHLSQTAGSAAERVMEAIGQVLQDERFFEKLPRNLLQTPG